jgi:hypothetical protein
MASLSCPAPVSRSFLSLSCPACLSIRSLLALSSRVQLSLSLPDLSSLLVGVLSLLDLSPTGPAFCMSVVCVCLSGLFLVSIFCHWLSLAYLPFQPIYLSSLSFSTLSHRLYPAFLSIYTCLYTVSQACPACFLSISVVSVCPYPSPSLL